MRATAIVFALSLLPVLAAAQTDDADWLDRCRRAQPRPDEQALFAIVQGGVDPGLRRRSALESTALELDSYAIGGLSVGEERSATFATIDAVIDDLPPDRPRYVMGMGTPGELVRAVALGVDMFDSVLPTSAAHDAWTFGVLQLTLRNGAYDWEFIPVESGAFTDSGTAACR